ncbi:MAG: Uma2 family endonuclease [Bryobacterales bacterium]|nr:Uma2 family endonuclease [Bryobacterales bacterium]
MPTTATVPKQFPAADSGASVTAYEEPETVEYPEGRWTPRASGTGTRSGRPGRRCTGTSAGARTLSWQCSWWCTTSVAPTRRACSRTCRWCSASVAKGTASRCRIWEEGKAPDFVLEVLSPSTAENEVRHRAMEYARIGVREYWRLDPAGSLEGRPLEGYTASKGRHGTVEPVGRVGRGWWLRSRVLGLDLRGGRDRGATVAIFRDPRTGEMFDGRAEDTGRWGRIAENWASDSEERVQTLEERLRSLTAHAGPEASE